MAFYIFDVERILFHCNILMSKYKILPVAQDGHEQKYTESAS